MLEAIYEYDDSTNKFVPLTGSNKEAAEKEIKSGKNPDYMLDLWTDLYLPVNLTVSKECYFSYMDLAKQVVQQVMQRKRTRLIGYLECGYLPLFIPPSSAYSEYYNKFAEKLLDWCAKNTIPVKSMLPMSFSNEEARFNSDVTFYWIHKLDFFKQIHPPKGAALITVQDVWNSVEGL